MRTSKKPELLFVEDPVPTCRVCGSKDVSKAGTRLDAKNKLLVRGYHCNTCGTAFTAGKRRYMKFPDYVVRFSLFLVVKKGYYCSDAATFTREAFGLPVTGSGVTNWVHRYHPEFKLHRGLFPIGRKVYKPHTRKGADKATVRGIRALLKEIDGKLKTFEKRAEKFP